MIFCPWMHYDGIPEPEWWRRLKADGAATGIDGPPRWWLLERDAARAALLGALHRRVRDLRRDEVARLFETLPLEPPQ